MQSNVDELVVVCGPYLMTPCVCVCGVVCASHRPTADWNYHCGASTGAFGSLRHFTPSINARFGAGTSAADYLKKAQLAAYVNQFIVFHRESAREH